MNLYLLQLNHKGSKISPTYDVARGFVIRALDDRSARCLAAEECGDEGSNVWWGETFTSCELLASNVEGGEQVLLRDFNAG